MNYSIFQLPIENDRVFSGYDEDRFNADDYELVYSEKLDDNMQIDENLLEALYMIYNVHHPEDYKGRSMTASDVIVFVNDDSEIVKAYYCDITGWTDITNKLAGGN